MKKRQKKQTKLRRFRPRVEQLEPRVAPTSMMGLGAALLADYFLADLFFGDLPSHASELTYGQSELPGGTARPLSSRLIAPADNSPLLHQMPRIATNLSVPSSAGAQRPNTAATGDSSPASGASGIAANAFGQVRLDPATTDRFFNAKDPCGVVDGEGFSSTLPLLTSSVSYAGSSMSASSASGSLSAGASSFASFAAQFSMNGSNSTNRGTTAWSSVTQPVQGRGTTDWGTISVSNEDATNSNDAATDTAITVQNVDANDFTGQFQVELKARASSEKLASRFGFVHESTVVSEGNVNIWSIPDQIDPRSPIGRWIDRHGEEPERIARLLERNARILNADPVYQTPSPSGGTVSLAGSETDIIAPYQRTAPSEDTTFDGQFVVELEPGVSSEQLAARYGLEHEFSYPNLSDNVNVWRLPDSSDSQTVFTRRLQRFADNPEGLAQQLVRDAEILDAYPVYQAGLVDYGLPDDPMLPAQWHLYNVGQTGGTAGMDSNVQAAWDMGMSGKGATVGINELNGIEYTHEDLTENYDALASYDFSSGDDTPLPASSSENHGTAVAGVAAARGDNGIGGSGVAPDAPFGAIRSGGDDSALAWDTYQSGQFDAKRIDIINNSWGPTTQMSARTSTRSVMADGVVNGRGGLGTIYVFAGGNYRSNDDNVNYGANANSRYTIAVGAVGHDGVVADYSNPGAALLVSALSQGEDDEGITTTDRSGSSGYSDTDYFASFNGTSSAAPYASGVIALMLEANPNLTWRDVQHILVDTAISDGLADSGFSWDTDDWTLNGADHPVNHDYGFGLVNASGAVTLASNWQPVGPELVVKSGPQSGGSVPNNNSTGIYQDVTITPDINVEHVEVVFSATHARRGDLEVTLTSPSGTISTLAETRSTDGVASNVVAGSSTTQFTTALTATTDDAYNGLRLEFTSGANSGEVRTVTDYVASTKTITVDSAFSNTPAANDEFIIHNPDYNNWVFSSTRNWDEGSAGTWRLTVKDLRTGETGTWDSWQLNVYGTEKTSDTSGPRATGVMDVNGLVNGGSVSSIRVQFDEPIDPTTFTASDITVQRVGGTAATIFGVSPVSGSGDRAFDVSFNTQSTAGNYRVDIGPNIEDDAGNLMNQDGDTTNGESVNDKYTEHFAIGSQYIYSEAPGVSLTTQGNTYDYVSLPAVEIGDLNVLLNIEETYVSWDLLIYLRPPGGSETLIVNWDDDNNWGYTGNGYLDTVLDEEATLDIDADVPQDYDFTNSYQPSNAFTSLEGSQSAGDWRLRIYNFSTTAGRLNNFALIVTPAESIDISLDSVTNTDADRDKVEVTYTVTGGTAPSFDLGVYDSTDPFFNINSDINVGTFTVTTGLTEGTHTVEVPASYFPDPDFTRSDELYSIVIADPERGVFDQDRSNNQGILAAGVTQTPNDTLYITANPFTATEVVVTSSSVTFDGGTPISYSGFDPEAVFFTGSTEADTFSASGVNEKILAFLGAGDDTYTGGNLTDAVQGGPGHDTLNGNGGNDSLYGMAGNDTVDGGADNDTVSVGPGGLGVESQSLSGGTGNDYLLIDGTANNDRITVWDPDGDTGTTGGTLQATVQSATGNVSAGSAINGPDSYGYTARETAYQAIDLVPGGAGVTTLVNGMNYTPTAIDLGSNTFNFYGTSYTGTDQLYVSPNGFISFGAGKNTGSNFNFSSSAYLGTPFLAPFFDDLSTVGGSGDTDSTVLSKLDATNDLLTIEWSNVPHKTDIGAATFQVILELNTDTTPGDITFNYVDVDFGNTSYDNGASATVGIQDPGDAFPVDSYNQLDYNGTGPGASLLTSESAFVFTMDTGYNAAVVQEISINSVDSGDRLVVNGSYGDDVIQLENTDVTSSKLGLDAVLIGGPGDDTLYDGLGSDVLIADSAYTDMDGDGTDSLYSSDDGKVDKLVGKNGTDTFNKEGSEDNIVYTTS